MPLIKEKLIIELQPGESLAFIIILNCALQMRVIWKSRFKTNFVLIN